VKRSRSPLGRVREHVHQDLAVVRAASAQGRGAVDDVVAVDEPVHRRSSARREGAADLFPVLELLDERPVRVQDPASTV
jgi:hypothetical protein